LSYWAVVVARNAAPHLSRTLDSLLGQTEKPRRITVVDDGSTDETGKILDDYEARFSIITTITKPNRGYDIRRVPLNINLAWERNSAQGLETDYFMISGDDCFYPNGYVASLASRMSLNPQLMVASGRPVTGGSFGREHSPSGSGRMIRCAFWREIGGSYPPKAGWEAWLLFKAEQKGREVRLFEDLTFEHVRPRGATHQFVYWGAAMGTLGYNPLYAMGRLAKNAVKRSVSLTGSVSMLRGYLQSKVGSADAFITPFDPQLRDFVRREQSCKIARIAASLVRFESVW